MTAYGTIKIPHEDYERHNTNRKELNQTWAEYIDGQEPDYPTESMSYDDVKAACQAAIREEFNERSLG